MPDARPPESQPPDALPFVDLVCLSQQFDLKAMFTRAFARQAPWVRLLAPDEVRDPAGVGFAFAHDPAPDAFERFPNLRLICSWGAGVDGLLGHPGLPPGLPIKRMTDPGQAEMMAAFAVFYVTGWQRRMFDYPAQQARREWRDLNWVTPAGFAVGVLGFGNMGRAVAAGIAGLGFPVTAWAGRAREEAGIRVLAGADGLARVLAESAAVINVLPLTPATAGILDAAAFAQMRDDAILIQIGRGAHVVEPDLIAALDAGRPALAALDVTSVEPLPAGSPLWSHPRVMLTPHVASEAHPEAVARSVAEGVRAVLEGRVPAGLVDRGRGY